MAQQSTDSGLRPETARPTIPEAVATTAVPSALTDKHSLIEEVSTRYGNHITSTAETRGIPEEILRGSLREGLNRLNDGQLNQVLTEEARALNTPYQPGMIERLIGSNGGDEPTRVGIGQTTMLSAGAVEHPSGSASNYTQAHYNTIQHRLKNPEASIDTLAQVLKANHSLYGEITGKTEEDRWKFAVAKHLAEDGRDTIGAAQQLAGRLATKAGLSATEAMNNWEKVSQHLPPKLVGEVERACAGYRP